MYERGTLAILDPRLMSQNLVGLDPLLQGVSLASLLESCSPAVGPTELHNAGNSDTYTLHLALTFVLMKNEGGHPPHADQRLVTTRL